MYCGGPHPIYTDSEINQLLILEKITGNLNVIPDARVRNIISKGPKYRFLLICKST